MKREERKYLTIGEVADMLGYSRPMVVECLKNGAPYIAPKKLGMGTARAVRVVGEDFVNWLRDDAARAAKSFRSAEKPTIGTRIKQ